MLKLTFAKALKLFELIHQPWERAFVVASPTEESIKKINLELGIQIPQSVITCAINSSSYGAWFAGLGEDYNNPLHILNINQVFRSEPETSNEFIPDWLVIINHGHDGDCDCLDTRNYDPITGEYPIVYWCYDLGTTFEIDKIDRNFSEYLESMLLQVIKNLERSDKRKAEKILIGI